MTFHIIYTHYYDWRGNEVSVGGIQTYITNISRIIIELGYDVVVHQLADCDFTIEKEKLSIIGYKYGGKKDDFKKASIFFKQKVYSNLQKEKDIVIFATDTLITAFPGIKCIGIQHGIGWDIPHSYKTQFDYFLYYFARSLKSYNVIKKYKNVSALICVDYNFVNWYRAITAGEQVRLRVIPNFSTIPIQIDKRRDSTTRIIFARRFTSYRGTRLFAEAIKYILGEAGDNLHITIAGEGPDEIYIKETFRDDKRVTITSYKSEESIEIHKRHDIAVIPTLGSEGTSLSLLEAMAAGCAVICTDVGGMTNIVINGFNGTMIHPTKNELIHALEKNIRDIDYREYVAANAYETVAKSFSYDNWKRQWIEELGLLI